MPGKVYIASVGAWPTTASLPTIATGASIKTLMQVATPSTCPITVIGWGISCDGSAAATPGKVELIQTDVAATSGTSLTPGLWGDPNAPASLCVGGTGATCFGPTVEGSITATRIFDPQLVAPSAAYSNWFSLGYQPVIPVSKFLRIRVLFGTGVNVYAWIVWEE